MKWFKRVLWAITALVVLAVVVPYLPADILRPGIERALERGLGRKVDVEGIRLTLLPGPVPRPGFTLDRVTIHEDPRAGIEPLAYVESLGASLRVWSLFQRRLEFSSLNLNDATINLVKTDAGPWNFQFLLQNVAADSKRIPSIRMRAGRVNFKFGDTKSVFYFNDADLDVTPSADGSMELRFGGAPSRTDRSTQEFGRFFVHGAFASEGAAENRRLDLKVELERSPLEETLRWMDSRGFDVHGTVALEAQISGPPSHLDVAGQIQLADVHRWDLIPNEVGGMKLGFGGSLDLPGERLDLQTTANRSVSPLVIRFRSWDFLNTPHWDAGVDLQQVPLTTMLAVCRHMGATLPENLSAQGSVSGTVTYNEPQGIQGRVVLRDASLRVPEETPLEAPVATVDIAGRSISLEHASIHIGEKQSAEIEGSYDLDEPRSLDLKITTRGLSVASMRSFGLEAIPLLEQTPQGAWRGWARYHGGDWSGESELQNARIDVDGLADPVLIRFASVSLSGRRVSVNRLQAEAGDIAFTGSYRMDAGAESSDKLRTGKFDLKVEEADIAELSRLLAPALLREGGFLARTLRLGASAPIPGWLKAIRTQGTIAIGSLTAGELRLSGITANVKWTGPMVEITHLTGSSDPAEFNGDLSVDLTGGSPRYHFDGSLGNIAYKGGQLDLEGTLDAEGSGLELLENTRAEGMLRGRSILFAPDAEFRTVTARFEVQSAGPASRWKLSNVEVNQSGESLAGTGTSQADGRLVLELVSRGKPLRYTGTLFSLAGPP